MMAPVSCANIRVIELEKTQSKRRRLLLGNQAGESRSCCQTQTMSSSLLRFSAFAFVSNSLSLPTTTTVDGDVGLKAADEVVGEDAVAPDWLPSSSKSKAGVSGAGCTANLDLVDAGLEGENSEGGSEGGREGGREGGKGVGGAKSERRSPAGFSSGVNTGFTWNFFEEGRFGVIGCGCGCSAGSVVSC